MSEGKSCVQCPAVYATDPANSTLCQLYSELQLANSNAAITAAAANTTNSSATFPLSVEAVVCPYLTHPTSAEELCDLWCDLQVCVAISREVCSDV